MRPVKGHACRRVMLAVVTVISGVGASVATTTGVARAATFTISDQASCEAVEGSWDDDECSFRDSITIEAGDTWQNTVLLDFEEELTVEGRLVVNRPGVFADTVENNGVIDVFDRFRSSELLVNEGTINVVVGGSGRGGFLEVFPSNSVVINRGTIFVGSGGRIDNFGTVNNEGTITVDCGATISGNQIQGDPPVPLRDCSPPVITPIVAGALGANGWYLSDVQVSWNVTDPESAITSQTGCGAATITTDTTGITLTCTATSAGGTASVPVTIKRDLSVPTSAPALSPPANAAGWHNSDVTVTWNWADAVSGIDPTACPPTTTSSSQGTVVITGTCTDLAGNSAGAEVEANVDTIAPTLNPIVTPNPIIVGSAATASPGATDDRSGIASQSCGPVDTATVGDKTVTCTATDIAGNTATATASYSVINPPPTTTDLQVTLSGPSSARKGSLVTYTVTVTNTGQLVASNLATVVAATGLSNITPSPATGTGAITIDGRRISGALWRTQTLAPGAQATFTLRGNVNVAPGKYVVVAAGSLAATPNDPRLSNNIALTSTRST